MLARIALPILAVVAHCSGAVAQSPTKAFSIGRVHVGVPGSGAAKLEVRKQRQ
jgi:hypothetical protein